MRFSMAPRQAPQSAPAPQRAAISADERAPAWMAKSTSLAVTAWQTQRII